VRGGVGAVSLCQRMNRCLQLPASEDGRRGYGETVPELTETTHDQGEWGTGGILPRILIHITRWR
jgi:hypothetical protein